MGILSLYWNHADFMDRRGSDGDWIWQYCTDYIQPGRTPYPDSSLISGYNEIFKNQEAKRNKTEELGQLINMERRQFIKEASILTAGSGIGAIGPFQAGNKEQDIIPIRKDEYGPLAISMWDFSWLERRWPGAGYENWDLILDQLIERGYNSLRIDAYPHLLAEQADKEWTLLPVWDQQVWGSPDVNKVTIQPSLNIFISKCRDRKIKVALSSWFREDLQKTRMKIANAGKMAEIWIKAIESIAKDGLLDAILYVDLCNEWPGDMWAPFFTNETPDQTWGYWHTGTSMKYMEESIAQLRNHFPELLFCYSFDGDRPEYYTERDLSFFDLIEHHCWMAKENDAEFYKITGYNYERFSSQGYKNLAAKAADTYKAKPSYWQELLTSKLRRIALNAKKANLPLITTECWGIVDYKDWPLLEWDWVKETCALGAHTAASTGQWIAIASSNFCGPQFVGMWRDIEWHRNLTTKIRKSIIDEKLLTDKVKKRLYF
jgi:sugar phosphate isomerase/epimerase